MSRRRSIRPLRDQRDGPEQLPLPAPAKARAGVEPEQAAKVAIARRAKPSALSGRVKLVLTLDLRRVLAERLSAQAIREGKNLDALVAEILDAAPTGA
jgi:hypothetical protein